MFGSSFKRLFPNFLGSDADRVAAGAANAAANITVNRQALTHPPERYALWASEIFASMDGCGTATDEVQSIFETYLATNDDVRELARVYGSKTITCWIGGPFTGGLAGAIRSEISSSYLDRRLRNAGL